MKPRNRLTPKQALRAIVARIDGVWDDPALVAWGPLSTDEMKDVYQIALEGATGTGRR